MRLSYQFVYDNHAIKRNYKYITLIFTCTTLTLLIFNVFGFIGFIQHPNIVFENKCYDMLTDTYGKCTMRNVCNCDELKNCAISCFNTDDNQILIALKSIE